ncbi:MAG: hypothetical protein JWM81_304 [Candidatus Saccharibacteria bacterium]|nr:hypothetical protein [Candidatus Saccharibacteria bacterium]
MTQNRLHSAARTPIPTYWWRYDYPRKLNFGDELTPIIMERLFGRKAVWADPSQCELASTGSILELLGELSVGNTINVWGSGFIRQGPSNQAQNYVFHAVRGKRSRERLQNNQVAVGDPALLLPLIFDPPAKPRYELGIVPHYVDQADERLWDFAAANPSTKMIDVLDSPEVVVGNIRSCKRIMSSSLHGLIVADAFGIPSRQLTSINGLVGGNYKFGDHYSVFDSYAPAAPLSIDDITQAVLDPRPDVLDEWFSGNTIDPTELGRLQQGLIDSFPY